jgi:hypothetical protein
MTDPKRLIDPESRSSPALRTLLRAGRSELPDEERVEAMGIRLGALLVPAVGGASHGGPVGPEAGAAGAAAAGLKVGAVAKIGAVALVALGGVGGTYVLTSHERAITTRPSGPAAVSVAPPASGASSASPAPSLQSAPSAPAPESGGQVAVAGPASALAVGAADTEVSLLESAQDALASDPESALSLAERHAGRFPRGALAQEREVIAIEALIRLGRVDAARARAERFYRAFPRSAHRTRIENLLGVAPTHNP